MDDQGAPSGGIAGFIEAHPMLVLGGGLVVALILFSLMKKQNAPGVAVPQDLSGLKNGVVYVPTQTTFETRNVGADFSNDPNLQSIQTGAIVNNSQIQQAPPPVTQAKPVVSVPATPPPANPPPPSGGTDTGGVHPVKTPPPTPAPAPGVKWNSTYIIKSGDTLSQIANNITNQARANGAPSNFVTTYQQIFDYNKSIITQIANAHGNPIPGGAANNIFPGTQITLPTWG